jgi:AraC family transcriptional regulator
MDHLSENTSSAGSRQRRLQPVLDWIDAHPDGDLRLETLSALVAVSPFHFHRLFKAWTGIALHRYIRLSRLRRASYQLAYRPLSVMQVALDNGYQSPEAFAREFRRDTGQSPSAFRHAPDWLSWNRSFRLFSERSLHMSVVFAEPQLIAFPATRIACMSHLGDPALIGQTIQRFIAWRKKHHLHPSRYATLNILYNDPDTVAAQDFRLDLAIPLDADPGEGADGIHLQTIPAGRCAKFLITGREQDLYAGLDWLYRTWLPASGQQLRDFPLFLERIRFFPDVPEHQSEFAVYLPLQD